MSLSKYPERLDLFETKRDAQFDGDPNGDNVMADDVNALQDAISAIENTLGVNPQGNKISVGERITLLEGSSALRVPSFLVYLGNPSKINESVTTLEAAGHFAKYDHVVLGNNAQDPTDPDYQATLETISLIRASKDVKFYGYIDCGVNTLNFSLAEIQLKIQQWKDIDAAGIYCANFGFEDRVSRERQNAILDAIHHDGMVAILDADKPEELFTDLFHETMNPLWVPSHAKDGDIYHYNSFSLDTTTAAIYEQDVVGHINMLIKLYDYRVSQGIKIFATPVIDTTVAQDLAQKYYDYAHTTAIVTSMDAFHPVIEGYGASTNTAPTYNWMPIAGNWYMASPRIEYDATGTECVRELPFGRIFLNTANHTYRYEGLYIPYEMLKIAANTIEGNLLKDATVEDKKIKSYSGSRLIDAINATTDETKKINIAKIAQFQYSDLSGAIPVDHLKANVISAINANIGFATIGGAVIGDLTAGHIKSGTIDAGRITASVVEALNMYAKNLTAESAHLDTAVIKDLSAEKITAGNIDAERISSAVVEAINLSAKQAEIENLNADNITAGNIKAERIQAEIVNALNLYTENMVAGSAKIDVGVIGDLTAGHIRASVIEAINARLDTATINSAKIAVLSADHIKASVIDAINFTTQTAVIEEGKIGDLSATKITSGTIDADIIKGSVIDAINFTTQTAVIEQGKIGNLDAGKITTGELLADLMKGKVVEAINLNASTAVIDQGKIGELDAKKITAGDIAAERLQANIVNAVNAYVQNMTAQSAKIDSAAVGVLSADHMQAKVISAVNASVETIDGKNAVIDNAKIGSLRADQIEAVVISAVNANIGNATIDSGVIGKLTAANIDAGIINSTHITTDGLDASDIKTGTFHGDMITGNTLDAQKIVAGSITGREIMAGAITAKEIQAGSITSDEIQSGSITAEHISTVGLDAQRVRVYNSGTGQTLIGGGYLRVDGLDAGVVQSDNLVANGMFMTASSGFGIKRTNPAGEVIIGTESQVAGGNQIWKYDLDTGALVTTIDVPGKKPAFIAIDGSQQYAYITVQGNDTLVQLDLAYDTLTENFRPLGKAPTRVKFTGNLLGDMKHLFVVNTDKTDLNAPDSFYVMDVPPHSDFSQLYIHHQIITGNTPYDFVLSEKDKKVYITLSDQGDIAVLDASKFPTYQWKLEGAIPIAPYGTDNYHGGLTAGFGIGTAVGGDASASYNLNHGAHGGMAHGGHGGYSVSDGTMKAYKPRGIAIDKNENLLVVTESEQDELIIINRIEESHFEWPIHPDYEDPDNIALIDKVVAATIMYDNNPEQAIADGYLPASPYIPYMGYHFAKQGPGSYNPDMPNTIMYAFDTTVNQYKLIGAEWNQPDPTIPSPIPGKDWVMASPAMAMYEDGLMLPADSYDVAPKTHPETGSSLVSWRPAIWGVHMYTTIDNPLGLFEEFNPKCAPYNLTSPMLPPGFESYISPNVPNSNYHEYVSPTAGDTPTHGGGGGGHAHSVGEVEIVEMESTEPTFNAMAGGHTGGATEDPHAGHDMGIGPDTTGQGLVYKYVRHRIPIGDDPEFIEIAHGKVWITVKGAGELVVMNETDLYRTPDDIKYFGWEKFIRRIKIGAKPLDMVVDDARGRLYVTLNGDNQVAIVDMMTETVIDKWTAGANTMGGAITPDGRFLYVTNNGGVGELSFVYPEGPYIGDAFIGLEGDVQYQGALSWVPDRSDWVWNPDGTIRSSSGVEFRINEPFLNEGGYVKLSAQGLDKQYSSIEQDVYNVSNFSNGDNIDDMIGERLSSNMTTTVWKPTNEWLQSNGGVTNVKVVYINESGARVEIIPDPVTYTVYYDTSRIEFTQPVSPITIMVADGTSQEAEAWVEADYFYQPDAHFKYHNASMLIALENSSSKNFKTLFEVEEFVPKFITIDNQQVAPFEYTPIIDPVRTPGHYRGIEYSVMTNRAKGRPLSSITTNATEADISGGLEAVVNGDAGSSSYFATKSAESASLKLTNAPTSVGNVTVTLDGVAKNITVGDGLAEVVHLDVSNGVSTDGNVTVTLNGVSTSIPVSNGEYEAATINITSAPTVAGSIMIKLNSIMTMIPIDPAVETTAAAVANKIRATAFTGWSVGGTAGTTSVTFTATGIGARVDTVYSDNGTGALGSAITTRQGANPDSPADVATKIRNTSFTGWTTGGTGAQVIFTATTKAAKPSAVYSYSDNSTGAVGSIAIAIQGTNTDTIEIAAEKIRSATYPGWETDGSGDTITFEALTVGNKADTTYSAGTTGAAGTLTVTNQGVTGPEYVQIDLGATYMIGKLKVWHFWQDMRTYHGTKTEVSEDGVNWITVFDSAIEGEYMEMEAGHEIKFWAYPDGPHDYDNNYLQAKRVRYVRDWAHGNTVNANNQWVEIQVFGDWQYETGYTYAAGSINEGQQIATNEEGLVTTDVLGASATIELDINFTSWWYMTYLVGPMFGSFDVEMPTVMGGSHVLPLDNPYINKVAHRHIMAFPPGKHTAVLKQRSGKVAIDRMRFEDFQYFGTTSKLIPNNADTSFTRYKVIPEKAKNYIGSGNQSTYGPYDTPYVNSDTLVPDQSVPLKYRVRVKSQLDSSGVNEERGIAYITSAIFEQGRQSSHWRPSSSSDVTPGNRIERWDGNQPHKTGIQWFHLANGAVRGTKILPSAIMDYHISPYARIGEYKLDLNYPTHRHGHYMTHADGTQWFMDNKDILDGIMGWGTSGTSNKMARADHSHSHMMGDLMIHGKFEAVLSHGADGINHNWSTINGVEVNGFKKAYDAHVAATDLHFSTAERTKLAGISEGATKVEPSTTGKLKIDGVDTTIYAHPTGDGNLHVPATGTVSNGKFLKAGSAVGSMSWQQITWSDVSDKPTNFSYVGHSHTSADISDLNTVLSGYATKEELAQAGEVKLANANVFTNINTFTNPGVAVKIQPSAPVADNTVLFQIASYSGGNLVTMGKYTDTVTSVDVAKVIINGDLEVTGSTIQKSTQQIEGDMNVTGNLNITGNAVLGDSTADQTTVKGDLVVEGTIKPKGKSVEVGRFTVFGMGGDLQFQTDSTTYEDVTSHYSTFQTGDSYPLPAAQTGASRKYRLIVAYSTVGSLSAAKLKISQYSGTDLTTFDLPEVNGSAAGIVRHFRTPEFTATYTGHTTFKALSAGAGKDLIIKQVEVVAYDYFA
jgi:trimeric autotransporter adhesin